MRREVQSKALTLKEIETVVEQIVRRFHPQKVILYGSYAEGTAREGSDLDLLIVTSEKPDSEVSHHLDWEILEEYFTPVQIITMSEKEFEETKDVIGGIAYPSNKYGIVMYEKP